MRQLGGAVGRSRPDHGARGTLPGEFILFAVGIAPDAGAKEVVGRHASRVVDAVSAHRAPSGYLNFAERPGDAAALYEADAYARLCELKERYDADDLFRSNHPVK
jgi:Berberine and berberine like